MLFIHQGKIIMWEKSSKFYHCLVNPALTNGILISQLSSKVTEVKNSTYFLFSDVGFSFPGSENPLTFKKTTLLNITNIFQVPRWADLLWVCPELLPQCIAETLCCNKQSFKWHYYSLEVLIYPKCLLQDLLYLNRYRSIYCYDRSLNCSLTSGSFQSASKLWVFKAIFYCCRFVIN